MPNRSTLAYRPADALLGRRGIAVNNRSRPPSQPAMLPDVGTGQP
jgi:hypothetical protein